MFQPPRSEVLAKAKRQKKEKELEAGPAIPKFTTEELDKMLDASAVHQEILQMRHKGVSPFQTKLMLSLGTTEVSADTVDAVRWHGIKLEELQTMKLQDSDHQQPWIDEILEDLIAYDVSPSNNEDEAKTILKELNKELESKMDAGFGPEARNYIQSMKRELELIIDKL